MDSSFTIFLAWLISSFLSNYFLRKKLMFFKTIGTPINLFGISILFLSVHKITVFILNTQEFIFLTLSFLFLGLFLLSFSEKQKRDYKEFLYGKKKKRNKEEREKIKEIAIQSQLQKNK